MKSAVLTFWDPGAGEVVDLKVTWSKGHDLDAQVTIPKRHQATWAAALKVLSQDLDVAPYGSLPVSVEGSAIATSATGFYAAAKLIWGNRTTWREPPPYEAEEAEQVEGVVW